MNFLRRYSVPLLVALAAIALFHTVVLLQGRHYYGHAVWDEGYYLAIAQGGYVLHDGDFLVDSSLPFGPGYPLLLRGFASLFGGDFYIGRSVLSALLLCLGMIGVAELFDRFGGNRLRRNLACLLFASWPGALYFLSGYAEALYMPLAAWCLVAVLSRRYLIAAVLAALALFTRSPAIILVPVILVAALVDAYRSRMAAGWTTGWRYWWLQQALRLFAYGLICLVGVAGYAACIGEATGEPFAFLRAYAAWVGVADHGVAGRWMGASLFHAWEIYSNSLSIRLAVASFVLIPPLVIVCRRALPGPALAFVGIGWLFFLSYQGWFRPFTDVLRWSSILFPAQYCLVTLLERLLARDRLPRRSLVLGVCLLAILYGVGYAVLVRRYINSQWVS